MTHNNTFTPGFFPLSLPKKNEVNGQGNSMPMYYSRISFY